MINVNIDGKEVQIVEETTVLKAAELAGVWIPTMCHSDLIEPYGVCRLCSVEMIRGKRSRIVTACNYPLRNSGITILTNTPKIQGIRKIIMEFMLSRWPNVPVVKDMAKSLGVTASRFLSHEVDEAVDACILCGACVNICKDVVKANVLGFANRGIKREVILPYDEKNEKCIVCGACAYVCPTGHIKVKTLEHERGAKQDWYLGPKTAINIPTLQAVPRVPKIEEVSCIKMQTGGCGICSTVCEPGAINYELKDEEIEFEVGQILVTTGYKLFDVAKAPQFGYGRLDNVYTSLEFEHMLNSTGPTGGTVACKDGSEPRAVAILHCIGSRDENFHKYCSRVCCMYALKFAHLVKDRTKAEVYQFYIDMRAFGKGYEEFYKRLLDEGVNMIRGKVAEVTEGPRRNGEKPYLLVNCEDTLIGKFRNIAVDMVILCPAFEPQTDASEIKKILSINQSPDKFYLERHPKLDPVSTMTDGIFIAGASQGPKDIPDSVAQASAAAARILSLISVGEVAIDPIKAEIQPEYCSGCKICNNLCPYNAISFLDGKKISEINDMLCKGCGTCVAACPSSAITGKGFSDKQILTELEGLLTI
jgi:heterodisulfide reductase subunit A